MPRIRPTIIVLVALAAACFAPTVRAGVGSGESGPAAIDTRAPVVTIDPLPAHLLVQGGQTHTFGWQTDDDHPGSAPAGYTATMWTELGPGQQIGYHPDIEAFSWEWTAPELSTARARLVVLATDAFGNVGRAETEEFSIMLSATDVPRGGLPATAALLPPEPNPFNPRTSLRLELPTAAHVRLTIHDAAGRRVRGLVDGTLAAGRHLLPWQGRDDTGRAVASGVYFARFEAAGRTVVRPLTLVR